MKTSHQFLAIIGASVVSACATAVPPELVKARAAHNRAAASCAAELAPAELHAASEALALAEQSFIQQPESYQTTDLAYIAERKAQLAEVSASSTIPKGQSAETANDRQDVHSWAIANEWHDLGQTPFATTTRQLNAEREARTAADKRAADSRAALARLATVKTGPRGTFIILTGTMLFAPNRATVSRDAKIHLGLVTDILLTNKERNLIVEGHTDSQGSRDYNVGLSQRRADAVRSYLVERGYQGDLIKARGLGKGSPVADNSTSEGRTNNRRVEIVVAHETAAADE